MTPKRAYATLITRSSYLAGVIVLAYTLRKHGSQYPLVVLYTSTLNQPSKDALALEASATNLVPREVDALLPLGEVSLIAERFADTWTKLRVFELLEYDEVCYLDADITINNRNADALFDDWAPPPADAPPTRAGAGPARDWLSAVHACVCNLDHDGWAPKSWGPNVCPFTHVSHPGALTSPSPITRDSPPEYDLLNGGLFLFRPSKALWDDMLHWFERWGRDGTLKAFMFPDQDFLAEYFKGRWAPMPWQFDALKTWRYWHPNLWRDDEVVVLHYIVDKPWVKKVGEDGKAGYRGDDGHTHALWWGEWDSWAKEREGAGQKEVVELVGRYVAGGADTEGFNAIGAGVQDFAKKGEQKPEQTERRKPLWDLGDGKKASAEEAASYPEREHAKDVWKNKPLAEKGHGPVVHSSRPPQE